MKPLSIKKEKIRFFEEKILDFFENAGREHLPWRKKKIAAYEVWVSEIMLQQTQVNRVIEYYSRFLKRFPTVHDLAEASWEEFLPYYQGLGYYARGRNMLKAAQVIVNEHDGEFPRNRAVLQKIPGIGPYTASAIMSFAYGEKHLAWDTNLRRAVGRYFRGAKELAGEADDWEGRFTLPRKTLNAALMDFGSAICVARPKCGICPVRSWCLYFKEKGAREKRTSQIAERFPMADAPAVVFLHASHRLYYSSQKKAYAPFFLPPGFNSRSGIKEYFQKKYGLNLAVRPPHKKTYYGLQPVLLIRAQILLGTPQFRGYSKEAAQEYCRSQKL